VDQWLFRPVEVTGRFLHNKTMLIPNKSYGLAGFEYVVPLCIKETKEGIPLEGILVNKGFFRQIFILFKVLYQKNMLIHLIVTRLKILFFRKK
jgi:hypothetical protein